jgi:ABC-2 type transport system permease protein
MNSPSNGMTASHGSSQAIAPAAVPATRPMYWSVRRELWENRWVYIAPLAAAVLFLFGFLINIISVRRHMHAMWPFDPAQQRRLLETPYEIAAALIMGVAFLVGIFYALDALYGERRDRSILFWKSLPVSDVTAVMSKLIVPIAILPLLSFVITIATQWVMLVLSGLVLVGSGVSFATLWTQSSFMHFSWMLLYHIVTVHGLWYAPIYGWLLLVSAWAPRAPFLFAFLPPFVIWGMEKLAFNTSHFLAMLQRRMIGPEPSTAPASKSMMDAMAALGPWEFFTEPGLWIGLAIAAVFLAGAIRLRRYRGPI